ncbi:MAG TPA: nicotinamide riboside transporter PnuC [Bacteroidales bacterium]|nr:nicotinamide riboside transporter PnuC [Bacteroidales bacterium]
MRVFPINVTFAPMDMAGTVQLGPFETTYPEVTAVAFGLACVWFMKKESAWAFPLGIVNVLIYIYIFFISRLYANAAINAFFFVMSVYGWYNWTRKTDGEGTIRISRCSRREMALNLAAAVVFFIAIRWVLIRYTESPVPGWDAATTAVYMVAQWLLSRKRIENWLLWISADSVMTVLLAWQGLWFSSFQYLVFTIIAILGYREWRAKLPV